MPTPSTNEALGTLRRRVLSLHREALAIEEEYREAIAAVPPDRRDSARNLVHYLAVRRHDIRDLQIDLRNVGLSSLGRMEAHVLPAIEAVLSALDALSGEPNSIESGQQGLSRFREGNERLASNATALLGAPGSPRARVRIMVTMPTEAATDVEFVHRLVEAGMDVARINSAHDTPSDWERMADNIRAAANEQGRAVRLLVDLAGRKIRTGDVSPGPALLRLRPLRDDRGRVLRPARVRLVAKPSKAPRGGNPEVPVGAEFVRLVEIGDELQLRDASGRRRKLEVTAKGRGYLAAEASRTVRFETGLALKARRGDVIAAETTIGSLPRRPGVVLVETGDRLRMTSSQAPGHGARFDDSGTLIETARIPVNPPEVIGQVAVGDPVLFDDGLIAGVVEAVRPDELVVRITAVRRKHGKLRGDKGVNLPGSALTLPPLSGSDELALDVAARVADIVGMSFVESVDDVEVLYQRLGELDQLGVILKIETERGFRNLPNILLAALRRSPVGVMVARGDLGVELGFERMAEVQEEILWLCEAAHVPVVWATQVLEGLVKRGVPTRSDVTDAALSARAECVMLNKGPHVVEAVSFLDDVLSRMLDHHVKKTPLLRRLKVSEGRWDSEDPVTDSSRE